MNTISLCIYCCLLELRYTYFYTVILLIFLLFLFLVFFPEKQKQKKKKRFFGFTRLDDNPLYIPGGFYTFLVGFIHSWWVCCLFNIFTVKFSILIMLFICFKLFALNATKFVSCIFVNVNMVLKEVDLG